MKTQYFISFDGAKIAYTEKRRSDMWIVFLHGLGGDAGNWEKEQEYFARANISTLAIDLRGHGLSDRGNTSEFYAIDNFVEDIHSLLTSLRLSNVLLVGHCFGGMISIAFATKYQKFLKGLVLIDTGYRAPFVGSHVLEQKLLQYLFHPMSDVLPSTHLSGHADYLTFVGTSDLNIERLTSNILHTSLRSYLSICTNFLKFDAPTTLNKINVTTLVIEGEKDTIFPPETARDLSHRIKNAKLVSIPNANHILVINNPIELSEAIGSFLQKIPTKHRR